MPNEIMVRCNGHRCCGTNHGCTHKTPHTPIPTENNDSCITSARCYAINADTICENVLEFPSISYAQWQREMGY